MPVITVNDIGKSYPHPSKPICVLDHISFSVEEGQFVSIVGRSGCGKSTLLQVLAGLLSANEGSVSIDNELVRAPMPGKVAMVFQDALLLPWRTAFDDVVLPLQLSGVPIGERRQRATEMLELVGLAAFADSFPHQLSGGMRQRVSIARGLVRNPRIIMMDEPFGALDEQTRMRMGDELLRIWTATRKTILFITHSLSEAVYLSDVVRVMAAAPGRIVDEVAIDLPRPRTLEMMGSERFGQLRNRVWKSIAGTSIGEGERL
ncbi:MAG: ABC transporter ATP-binding protein [Xanthobacteraceae bacterium]|jgi:NitT/TauT family transport system ATP-binding protein